MNKRLHQSNIFLLPLHQSQKSSKACLPSVWSMFVHNAHGTMISGSSFMLADRFATYRVWCRFVHYKPTKSWKSCNSEAKFVYNVTKRVLMQLQPKIWKETSACT